MSTDFIKSNYHVHTNFCDGLDSPRTMAEAAVKENITSLGILCHSMWPFSSDWHIPVREHDAFLTEVKDLKKEFSSKMDLYAGFEADYIPGMCRPDFSYFKEGGLCPDYIIGSVHYVQGNHGLFTVDGPEKEFTDGVKNYFAGDYKKAIREYFYLERIMIEQNDFTFIGHPDLIRKLNGRIKFFDENDEWYKNELKELAKVISSSGKCVEVNTGAIAKGYTDSPYPSRYFLELLYEKNVPITVSTDAHSKEHLGFWYEKAVQLIKETGYREAVYLKNGKYAMQPVI